MSNNDDDDCEMMKIEKKKKIHSQIDSKKQQTNKKDKSLFQCHLSITQSPITQSPITEILYIHFSFSSFFIISYLFL